MFQEWARNRYGVFPESGFAGDALYPEFYTDDDGNVTANEDCDGIAAFDRSDSARINNGTAVSSETKSSKRLCWLNNDEMIHRGLSVSGIRYSMYLC